LAERQAALAQIETLAAQIEAAERQLRFDQANTYDLNMSTSQYWFTVNEGKRQLAIDDARERLYAMQLEYRVKYKDDGANSGIAPKP
jgi:hypothetical protein